MGSRRSGHRTRFAVIAAAAGVTAALASGLTGALVAGPAAAAPTTTGTSCRAVSMNFGSFSGSLAHCSDHKDTGGGGAVSTNGFGDVWTITWSNGQETQLFEVSPTPVSPNVCPTGDTEENYSGTVDDSSTPSITVGMTLNANLCVPPSGPAALPNKQVLTIS